MVLETLVLFRRTLTRSWSFAPMAEMVRQEPLEHHANSRLLFGPEKRRGFECKLERLVIGQAVFTAKNQHVAVHRKSERKPSQHPEGRFRDSRFVATYLIRAHPHQFGKGRLRKSPGAAQFSKLFGKLHGTTLVRAKLKKLNRTDNKQLNRLGTMEPSSSFFHRNPESLAVDAFDAELLDAVIDHWHDALMTSKDSDATFRFLGISQMLAERLRIGVSDRTLGLEIPGKRWKTGLLIRTRLEEWGILRSTGHEAFRGCVVVPVVRNGAVTGLFARRLDRSRDEFWARGLGSSMFEVPSGDDPSPNVLVTSSILDALSALGALEDSGESYLVVAPGAAKGFSPSDVRSLTERYEHVTVLGRGSSKITDRLVGSGIAHSLAGEDCEVASALTASANPAVVLHSWLEKATTLAPVSSTTVDVAAPVVTSTSERDEVFVNFAARAWRVRGARSSSNGDGQHLQVALSVNDQTSGRFHLDTLDLYMARLRHGFLDAAATELHASREKLALEMADVLSVAERTRDEGVREDTTVVLSDEERRVALSFLEDDGLFGRLTTDLSDLGVVGESTNLLMCYLATVSRKCQRPLGVLVQSSSAGGKSTLVDAVCSLLPPEDLVTLSAITSQALYYLGGSGLSHKVLYVAEEHGAQRASYALKLLLSEGRLAIATTGKDHASGRLQTTNYETAGPVALLMTTTATTIDPELENRLFVLGVNEDPSQTAAIIASQRHEATRLGFANRVRREEIRRTHANVQRLLQPMPVVISDLEIDFPSTSTRHRRDHAKLLALIATITLLHQFQREHLIAEVNGKTITYLEASHEDIARGLTLAGEVFARRDDHLAPQAQRLLHVFQEYATTRVRESDAVIDDVELTRRELRELLGWSLMQVRAATDALVALEYLIVAGGGRGRCRTYHLVGAPGYVGGTLTPTTSPSPSSETTPLVELVSDTAGARTSRPAVAPYEETGATR